MAARVAFDFADEHYGQCLLRIEDIDHTRCRAEFTQAIYEDLDWLGFSWPQPVRLQSAHLSDYQAALENLRARGLLYECFKTRSELALSPPAQLPKSELERQLAAEQPYALRLSIKTCAEYLSGKTLSYMDNGQYKDVNLNALDDVVLARKDIDTSYHMAVTYDDMFQGISHVVRGYDLQDQTPYHVVIQTLMGWPVPIYHHHDLIMDDDGKKLSKRSLATSIKSLRDAGLTPHGVLEMAQV